MAIKKKVKISNVKRSQHLKHKKNFTKPLQKKDKLQPNLPAGSCVSSSGQSTGKSAKNQQQHGKVFGKPTNDKRKSTHTKFKQKKSIPPQYQEPNENDDAASAEECTLADDIADMLDDGDDDDSPKVDRKRKRQPTCDQDDDDVNESARRFESEYAASEQVADLSKKRMISLLPIKTKDGELITRQTEEVEHDDDGEDDAEEPSTEPEDNDESADEFVDSDDDVVKGDGHLNGAGRIGVSRSMAVSTADLLILREQEIGRQKYRIGIICSGILEKPEDKMKNFTALFELLDERNGDQTNLVSVRKIAAISLLEVFKDILPEYRIGQVNLKMQTVRKNTMERVTYENVLLQQFKKYLQKLEKIASVLTKRSGSSGGNSTNRNKVKENMKLAEVAVVCLCELLIAHPYFNFGQNICQLLVYMLNCHTATVRTRIHRCFVEIFKTDKKLDLTLFIVRRLNHLIKSKLNNVHIEVITCLLALPIKSINLDMEKEHELKQKKLEAHKARLINMSKKEKKRHKKLAKLDKDLQETKAEENKQTKHYKLTEVTKMVFTIFFRILKNEPNSQLLSATLEGLAQFAHVINLDFFSDLVEVLNHIMETAELGYREQLHCIQTVFTILSGQGEALNIDPLRFYGHLYRNLLTVNAGQNHGDLLIILRTLNEVLVKRRKNITQQRLLAFVKRLLTLSMQLLHNGTAGCLGIVKTVMQLTSSLDIILDTDTTTGSGRYDPELEDPEFCNANCTTLYEVAALVRHYHPVVRKMAANLAAGVPASGEHSLNPEISKLTAAELYEQYDSSEMAFTPPIPPPKHVDLTKEMKGRHFYLSTDFEKECRLALKPLLSNSGTTTLPMDFCANYRKSVNTKKHQ